MPGQVINIELAGAPVDGLVECPLDSQARLEFAGLDFLHIDALQMEDKWQAIGGSTNYLPDRWKELKVDRLAIPGSVMAQLDVEQLKLPVNNHTIHP